MGAAERVPAIREQAEALLGRSLGEEGDRLTSMVVLWALAYCRREDIPEAMELPLARLVAATAEGDDGAAVRSLTRGDTSVTYDVAGGGSGPVAGLAPFRRLGRLGRDGA